MSRPKLGQHWLRDPASLFSVAEAAGVTDSDTVLEIGPGPGTLTEVLAGEAKSVIAVEIDKQLADKLRTELPAPNVEVFTDDFLKFNLDNINPGYKVAANIPYYVTSPIVMKLLTDRNRPVQAGLLVQKEVAERMAAEPGALSVLGIAVQSLASVELKQVVPAHLFTPPPEVDSQIITLKPRTKALFKDHEATMKLVKAGFLNRRKTLVNSLSGTLKLDKTQIQTAVLACRLADNVRAQELTLEDWQQLYDRLQSAF